MPNESVEASISSTVKRIYNGEQTSDKNLNFISGNTFESINIESSGIRKNLTYVTEKISANHINKDQYHV